MEVKHYLLVYICNFVVMGHIRFYIFFAWWFQNELTWQGWRMFFLGIKPYYWVCSVLKYLSTQIELSILFNVTSLYAGIYIDQKCLSIVTINIYFQYFDRSASEHYIFTSCHVTVFTTSNIRYNIYCEPLRKG